MIAKLSQEVLWITHRFLSSILQLSYLIFSFLNDKPLLAPKYSEYFTWSAPPLLFLDLILQSDAPPLLYSWSGSLIRSAYYSLYISFCFRFNKTLTNLTSLCQHHLQYTATIDLKMSCEYPQLKLVKKVLKNNHFGGK